MLVLVMRKYILPLLGFAVARQDRLPFLYDSNEVEEHYEDIVIGRRR